MVLPLQRGKDALCCPDRVHTTGTYAVSGFVPMDTLKALTLVGLNLGVLLTALLDRLSDALSLVLLLGLASVGFIYLWRRHPRTGPTDHEPASKAVYILEKKPTGLSLEGLRQRFQAAVESVLLGARLAYLYVVLFDPDLVLAYIDDPYLKSQVKAGRIETSAALFRCAAAVEAALKDQPFRDDPANTLGSYLRSKCKQRGWEWPKNPPEWKQHFIEHHAEVLS